MSTSTTENTPYAIVKTGGKQYRVQPGQRLLVERLAAGEGETVALQPLMYRAEDVVCDAAGLQKVNVSAKVLSHERGQKLRVFKFKPKRGYRRRTGHRQELTRIEVSEISLGAKAAPKRAAKPKDAAEPKAPAAKPAAKAKTAAAKKPQEKKPTKEGGDGA